MSLAQLKPCPFCEGIAKVCEGPNHGWWGTICDDCGVWRDDRHDTQAEAIAAWNTRTPDPAQIRADALRDAFQFPDDVIELAKRIGRAEWGATEPKPAEDHGADTVHTVKKTAAHFGQIDRQAMHGLYVEGTGIVICHAGVSPNSPEIARVLTGLWNMLCDAAMIDAPLSPTAVDNSPAPDAGGKEDK